MYCIFVLYIQMECSIFFGTYVVAYICGFFVAGERAELEVCFFRWGTKGGMDCCFLVSLRTRHLHGMLNGPTPFSTRGRMGP